MERLTLEPFVRIEAIAVPLDARNLDTNQLCPTRFNKVPIDDPGYHRILFHNQRFDGGGSEVPGFILNREPYRRAGVMVANENFGCGSSRESAVYALLAFGIRCVVAPSFGDIFYGNCTKNGLLPVVLPAEACERMRAALHARPGARIEVDLAAQTVAGPDAGSRARPDAALDPGSGRRERYRFDVHPTVKRCLLEGLDDAGLTMRYADAIEEFEARHHAALPWVFRPATAAAAAVRPAGAAGSAGQTAAGQTPAAESR